MKIGYVIGNSTPTEFLATLDPERPVRLYEYVAVDSVEIPPEEEEQVQVRLLGQVVRIFRDPYQLKRDLPLYEVVEGVSHDLLEVQIAKVKILGYLWNGEIHMPKMPPRIGAPVVLATDEEVAELYGRGELCVGRLAARPLDICLDMEGIKRHAAVIAATGSGKTWFSVVLIEELLKRGAHVVVLDPHGEYVPVRDTVQRLGPIGAVTVRVSRHHAGDVMYKIGVLDMDPEALADAAGVPPKATKIRYAIYLAHSLAKAAYKRGSLRRAGPKALARILREAQRGEQRLRSLLKGWGYAEEDERVSELAELAKRDRHSIFSASAYLKKLSRLGVFASRTTPLSKLTSNLTVVNLAGVGEEIQDYVAWHILTRIFRARVRHVRGLKGPKLEKPVVVFLEEAHRFAPPKSARRTRAYEAVARIAAEGRKFGVYLVVITQRPSRVDPDVMSQMQSQIIMRIVNPKDQEAVRDSSEQLAQEYLENLPGLDKGEAVILGPLLRLPAVVRLRDRVLEYGGGDIALSEAWRSEEPEVAMLWRRMFGRPPDPATAISASALRIVRISSENGVWRALFDDGAEAEASVQLGYAKCSKCGGSGCRHVYRLLSEAARRAEAAGR